jgi:hypothetical protein
MPSRGSNRVHIAQTNFVHIGRIDVVIDYDDEAIGIGAGVTLRSDQARLFGVTGILLLDRDR